MSGVAGDRARVRYTGRMTPIIIIIITGFVLALSTYSFKHFEIHKHSKSLKDANHGVIMHILHELYGRTDRKHEKRKMI